ncbi:MAG: PIN domain-containing protein [bacterium]|nr:PIN domain-containing protein [bacterium]
MRTSFRTVPDTNIVLASQNASASSPNKEFFDRWERDEFAVLYCEDTLREYIQKLLEHHVPRALIRKFIVELLELAERVEITFFHFPQYPPDVDDIPFLLCAANGNATHIISYDSDLHSLNGHYPFKVCKTLEFLFELRTELASST